MNVLTRQLLKTFLSVLPIIIIILIANFFIADFAPSLIFRFGIGAVLLIIGLSFFLIGVDLSISPLGNLTGLNLIKTNRLWIVIGGGLLLGFFVSLAEPGLLVLASQISQATADMLNDFFIVLFISIGLAIMVAFGLLRIIYRWPLYIVLLVLYGLILVLSLFSNPVFIALAFDASGATTGISVLPFILSLAVGISSLRRDSKASEKDSFGLVAVAATGPVFAMLILGLFNHNVSFSGTFEPVVTDSRILGPFLQTSGAIALESILAILPLIVIFLVAQLISFKLNKAAFVRILKGFVYVYLGLFLFLVGVRGGFVDIGWEFGRNLMESTHPAVLFIVAFMLGALTLVAEPSVRVLTLQIEEVTAGYIKPKTVYTALAIGVGLALLLIAVRITWPEIAVWHILLPSFAIALALMFFTPKIFVAIAFDAGCVATGPIIVSFIAAFVQGMANSGGSLATTADSFGMVAFVAVLPIVTLEILGIIYKVKTVKGGV
ncbi:MAG: DUF1538 domain-containing protein [Bacilli bacterium]|jgi:hypothetical protein